MNIVRVLFSVFFLKLKQTENSCQIFIEITAEFSKSEDENQAYSYEDEFNTHDYMYSDDSNERRTIREYSATASGNVTDVKKVLNEVLSHVKIKVINSFNVVGSNWTIRRIVNLNVSVMYDIISFTSISRLIKGKFPTLQQDHVIEEKKIEQIVMKCLKRIRGEGFVDDEQVLPKRKKIKTCSQVNDKSTPQHPAKLPVPRAPSRKTLKSRGTIDEGRVKQSKGVDFSTKGSGRPITKQSKSMFSRAYPPLEFSAENIQQGFFNNDKKKTVTYKKVTTADNAEEMVS